MRSKGEKGKSDMGHRKEEAAGNRLKIELEAGKATGKAGLTITPLPR
jgi:hypothetical protein